MEAAKQTIKKWDLCPDNIKIVVGVSGGADSVALLHLLWEMAPQHHWALEVVHVNHGFRGAEADHDQRFVEDLCKKWSIPCHSFVFDLVGEAKSRGLGEEEAGRQLRYESFAQVAKGGIVAVAHNQNDQSETILMRLCRGSGLKGLGGIRPKRGNIVRPLLYCSRKEIEEYCKKNNLAYCTDSTNALDMYTRNKMRNQVLPLLEEMYPKATTHIADCGERLLLEEDFLQSLAKERLQDCLLSKEKDKIVLKRTQLAKEHMALVRRMIASVLYELGQRRDLSAIHLESVVGLLQQETGKSVDLPKGICVSTVYETLVFERIIEDNTKGFSRKLEINGKIYVPEKDFFVETRIILGKIEKNDVDIYTKIFDYDTIKNTLFCRTRQNGDCFKFAYGTKKLKDFFIDTKVPKEERQSIPLIAFGSEVIWMLDGLVVDRYLPTEKTTQFLEIHIRRNEDERASGCIVEQ